jgi:hypothetical protein
VNEPLEAEYLAQAERDARRFSGAYTGTSGTLAAHTLRLLKEGKRMSATIAELEERNAELREAVEGRLAKTEPAPDESDQEGTIPADWILRGERELKRERDEPPVFRLRGDSLLQADGDDPPAAKMLEDAAAAVRQRRQTYGPPADHFKITVALINAAFGTSFKPEDWATIMQLDKIARSRGPRQTSDNDIDVAGYAACRFEVMQTP